MLNIITHHASIASTYTTETFIFTHVHTKMHPYPQLTQSSAHRGVVTL